MDNVSNVRETLRGYRVTQLKELCREVGISQCAKNKKTLIDRLTPIVLKSAGYEVVSIEKEESPKKIKRVPVKKTKKKVVEEEKKEETEKIKLDDESKEDSDKVSVEIEEDSNDESSVTESPEEN